MWTIYEKMSLQKNIKKIPENILKRYELWKRIIELDGINGIRQIRGFRDERLKGRWFGYRSSRLNNQWRVIYKLNKQELEVFVIEINPHKY